MQENIPDRKIRRKVLVVDDELINRRLLGFIVSRDYDVIYAENGVEALKAIKSNLNTLSLVLLDLLMPELDGFELLAIVSRDETMRRIPVIVLTSEKSAEVQALQLGAVDFITKPYDMPEVILARVNRSIELAEDKMLISESERDSLTGLYSRSFFMQYARQYDRYYPEMRMDAVSLNINRFHLINELYGRGYGDKILETIADMIRDFIGDSKGLACRCDADTFYLYVPHREDYDALSDRYSRELSERSGGINIIVRAGVYTDADIHMDIEQRFDRANTASAKMRNSYQTSMSFYDTQTSEKELYNERLIMEMDTALADRHFKVFYQPKYSIQGEKPVLTSAEALIRWIHPEYGIISPGVFIPLFEENGLVQKLDRYVWNETAKQITEWNRKFGKIIPVSVNMSRVDIYAPDLEEELTEILSVNGLESSSLLLEVTESAYTDNSKQIIEKVNSLRELGFKIEMDDFGSGYSSLNMLTSLPIDALKLDMHFIRNITENERDFRIVQLMLDIAGFLGVPVIAEGVETEKQYLMLKEAGCDIIQGYYFSKPVPPDEFEKFIVG